MEDGEDKTCWASSIFKIGPEIIHMRADSMF
jgi:hypothetical protein